MVVIEDLPQIKVAIRITGSDSDCVEYDDPDPPTTSSANGTAQHSIAKFIQSKDDAEFFIYCSIENSLGWMDGSKGLLVACYIDGKQVSSTLWTENKLRRGFADLRITGVMVPSVKPGKSTLKNFKFSTIKRVEDRKDKLKEDMETVKQLGIIEVVVYRAIAVGISRNSRQRTTNFQFQSELTKKALIKSTVTHGTSFTEGKEVDSARDYYHCQYPDGDRRIARFLFRYKSGTILENEGIIQRDDLPETFEPPPRLSPLSDKPTIDDLSKTELKRLAQGRLNNNHVVKLDEKIKREGSPHPDMRPSKVYKVDADGAIDLTEE